MGLLTTYAWPILGVGWLATAIFGGAQTWRLHSLETATANIVAECSEREASWDRQASLASEANRKLEQQLALTTQDLAHAQQAAKASTATTLASWVSERNRLRDTIEAFAAGRHLSPEAAASTAGDRAAALGRGLDEALRTEESLVGQLEDQRADTRLLLGYARAVEGVAQ